ncbi:MAG: ferritin-like domain-containing protein [Myxococcales bacterium]|nr:ferritin-like domain-containing protein [Myxococcales bacterium]
MANILRGRQTLPIDRRRLLMELALGTGAFAGLAGCGEKAQAQTAPDCEPLTGASDAALLETLVVMEDIAARTYEAAEGLLSVELKPAAAAFAAHHWAHKRDAAEQLAALGGADPKLVDELTHLPDLPDDLSILRYALAAEKQAVNAYLGILSQLTSTDLRYRAADILGCEIAHVVALRTVLPAPDGHDGDVMSAIDFGFITQVVAPARWRTPEE